MRNPIVNRFSLLLGLFWIVSCTAFAQQWLKPEGVRALTLERPLVKGLPSFVAAGSGLVFLDETRYAVIADEGLAMAVFAGDAPGRLHTLLERKPLPLEPKARKQAKPDFEALGRAGEGLLALGSGSRVNRRTGVWVGLPELEPREFDLAPLYHGLDARFPTVNIEGVAALPDRLRLAQRGNAKGGGNALVDLNLEQAVDLASRGRSWGPELILAEHPVELGSLPGSHGPVPFTFTDLAPLPDGSCLFTAAAEDTLSPVDDGRVLGAGLGRVDADGRVTAFWRLDTRFKCEGVAVRGQDVWLVTDADDPWQPGQLLRLPLPH